MINSRDVNDLLPKVAEKVRAFIAACKKDGIDIIITSTYRDAQSQNELYAQGRTKPGKRVTNARAGESWHNWRCAADFVPIAGGKAQWNNDALWNRCGAIAERCGLEWAGRFVKFREKAHVEYHPGITLADARAGKKPQ